jgi:hypothetical protein
MSRRRSAPSRLQPYVTRAFQGDATPHRPSLRGRIVRRSVGALAAVAILASLMPASADTYIPSLTISCDPTRVGVGTTCQATVTDAVSTTDTLSVPMEGMTKPIARGVFTRDNIPAAGSPIRIITKKVYWDTLEATRDVVTLAPIESLLDTAQSRGFDGVRLRFSFGADAPRWAKEIGDGPIDYLEAQSDISTTIPDIWDPAYQAEVEELMVAVAAEYDADPRVLLVFASGAQTYYSEPFVRGISAQQNRTNLLAAGYTKALDRAAQTWQLDIMRVFHRTPVGLAYNPWQFINPDGSAGVSVAYMAEVMDYHLSLFGDRTVLQNNSIRSSYISNPPPMYAEFLARLDEPGSTQYQAAGATRIGDADATVKWAIDYLNASGVELVNGYQDFHSDVELTNYDTALKTNDPPSQQIASHTVTWTTSADGTFGAGSCAPDATFGAICAVHYVPRLGSAGSHTITATIGGSGTGTPSASTQLRVSRRLSATTLTCATPVPAGGKSSCTTSVSDGSGGQVSAPTGTVRIAVDGAVAASCDLIPTSASASGCFVDVAAASGTHQVRATYGGDIDHDESADAVPVSVESPPEEPSSEEPPQEESPTEPPASPADTTVPTVTIVSPVDGGAIPKGKVTITAEASDDVGVTNVEFLVNGTVKCVDGSAASWTCTWTLSSKPVEGYTLSAIAYDAAGNRSEDSITVTLLR